MQLATTVAANGTVPEGSRPSSGIDKRSQQQNQKGMMSEKLLNIKEVCEYLGLSEEDLRKLVDRGEIPAYRLGGTILRFRKEQIDKVKAQGIPKIVKLDEEVLTGATESRMDKIRDLLYFNDFYIISAIIIIILLGIIFLY